ncbi:hypothetical protein ES703_07487 [subsurface metagenome]|nr:hypothetical protein [bacterium]
MATLPVTPVTLLRLILLVLGGLTSIKAVTRKEILARAQSFADMTWFADSANTVAWEEMYERYGCEEHLIRCLHTVA